MSNQKLTAELQKSIIERFDKRKYSSFIDKFGVLICN